MDSNDCILTINIIYNEKSFKLEIENMITIDELKTEIMNNFNIQDKDKENIKLFYKKEDKQIFISSEKELIENADCANPDNPKIDLNLLIEVHKEVIPLEEEGETPQEFEENILENNNEDKDKELIKNNNIDSNNNYNYNINNIDSNNVYNINNIDNNYNINNNNDNKYENLLKIIEDLKADIKVLKEEHSNKFVILKEENSEIRKENNEKFKSLELLQNEFYKFKDYIAESLAKNMESLNKKLEEDNEIQSKKINEIADEVNLIKNNEILSKNDDNYENKFNEMINPLRNEIKQKSDKIENLIKNVSSLENKFENQDLNKIINDIIIDNSNFKKSIKEDYNEIRKENNEKFKSFELLQNEFYEFKNYIAESLAKNVESLIKKWEEDNEIQSKKINEIADKVNLIKNNEILSKNDDYYENKFNEMINPLRNEIKQKSDKIENLIKNVSSLENKFENQDLNINKIINDIIIDNSNFKKSIKEDYNKICKENSEFKDSITKSFKENVIAIIFSSIDQTIHFAAVCYRSDPFSKVEKELYKEYPELKNKKFCFLFGGGTINRDGTLEENKIESNSNIIINYLD